MSDFKNKIQQIFERTPIPMDEIPRGHYLTGKDDSIMRRRAINKDINVVLEMIKNMSWKKISWDISGTQYTPILPRQIIAAINNIFNGRSEGFSSEIALKDINTYQNECISKAKETFFTTTYGFKGVTGASSYIYMNIDSGQRTHFPNGGISNNLRGSDINLGKKLYRALIEQAPLGYVKTISNATPAAQMMWTSLTHQQFKSNGSRDKDAEVYSFRFSDTLYVISTTIEDPFTPGYKILSLIGDKSKLISKENRKANGIGLDEDFVKLCKANKTTNNKAKEIISWIIPSAADRAIAKRIEAKREKARIEAEKVKERALKDRIKAYTGKTKIADLDSNWEVGDMIVVKHYLLQDSTYTPIRKVTNKVGNTYYAYLLSDINGNNRTTSDKTDWVKALMPAVGYDTPPGQHGTPSTARRRPTPNQPTQTTTPTPAASVTNLQILFNINANVTNILEFPNNERKMFLRSKANETLYVPRPGFLDTNCKSAANVPVFGYFITATTISNSKTMESIPNNTESNSAIKNNSYKFTRINLEDKRDLNPGDLVFIKSHSKFFGYVASVIRTSLSSRGDKYIYLNVPGAPRNQLTLTPRGLDKLVLNNTNESFSIDESESHEDAFTTIVNYCEELLGADLINKKSAKLIDNELGLFKTHQPNKLKEILTELDDVDFLPYDNAGYIEEPEDILELFDTI